MLITLIGQVIFLQLVVFSVIVFVLIKILNRHLSESAVHQFELLFSKEVDPALDEVTVVVCKNISPKTVHRIERSVFKKFKKELPIVVHQDKKIKGGMIIKLNDRTIDCSLVTRLRESGWIKRF